MIHQSLGTLTDTDIGVALHLEKKKHFSLAYLDYHFRQSGEEVLNDHKTNQGKFPIKSINILLVYIG